MELVGALQAIADDWRADRAARFGRRTLDPVDFARLRDIGVTLLPVPERLGGAWTGHSLREVSEVLRTLSAGDPSPALVSAMHPAVLSFWLANDAPAGTDGAAASSWDAQRDAVFRSAVDGAQWGTVTSEPGSGGDVSRTRTTAVPADALSDVDIPGRRYELTGDKHFGSGTGVCTFMFTTAIPEGEDDPAAFFVDTRAVAAGGDQPGFTVVKDWDGVGMRATQSHAVRLHGAAAVRLEWPGSMAELTAGAGPINLSLFTAVIVGVLDEAMAVAGERVVPHLADLRPYEQIEWVRATTDHWVAQQAYEGMLRAFESGSQAAALYAGLRGKTAVAELAEATLSRVARVVGGGAFSASSPFASWYEDVRALGFLRPPWGLAHDSLIASSMPQA